jgi:2-polyprenyl-6-hydroxyphenyl methylase / 3-demethylubiquinone-9 3-methyltransferase
VKPIDKEIQPTTELKKIYNRTYVEKFLKNQSPFRLNRLIKYIRLSENYNVVDFGCGNGMLMPLIADKVDSYVGVDFSAEFIDEAKKKKQLLKIRNAEFFCSEITKFCDDHYDSFDCAFTFDFFEHVYDDELLEILIRINKSLKKGGCLYIHTPNSLFIIELLKSHSIILKQLPGHIAIRSPEEIIRLLRKAGYSIKGLHLIPHYSILKGLHILSYLPSIGKYFKARIFIEAVK